MEEGIEEWTAENVDEKGRELLEMSFLSADEKRAIIHRQWMFQKGWAEKAKKSVGAKPPAKGSVSAWVAKLQEKLNDKCLQKAIAKARAEASAMVVEYPPLDINLGAIPAQPLIAEEVMRKRGAEVVSQAKHEERCTKHKKEDHRDARLWFITAITFNIWFNMHVNQLGGARLQSSCRMM